MPRYLVYIDASSKHILDECFDEALETGDVQEYYTLTEDGAPILFEAGQVSAPEFCNGLAIHCAGITEE